MTCKWGLNIALVMIFTEIVGDSGSAVHYPKLCHVVAESHQPNSMASRRDFFDLAGSCPNIAQQVCSDSWNWCSHDMNFLPPKNAMIRLILLTCFWNIWNKYDKNIRSWNSSIAASINMGFGGLQSTRSFPQIRGRGTQLRISKAHRQFIRLPFLKIPTKYHESWAHKFRCANKNIHIQDVTKMLIKTLLIFLSPKNMLKKQSSCLAFPVSIVKVQRSWLEEAVFDTLPWPLDSWIIRPQPSSNMKMIKCIIRLSSFNMTIYIYLYIYICDIIIKKYTLGYLSPPQT